MTCRPRCFVLGILPVAVLAVTAGPATAAPQVVCQQAEPGSIEIDGMLDDWHGVAKVRAGGSDPDASFDVRCLFDGERVLLAVDVRDEHVIRQPRLDPARPAGNDHLSVSLPGVSLTVFPGVGKVAPVRLLGKKPVDKAIVIEDTLQPAGWSVEVGVPVGRLTGWSPGVAALAATIRLADADVPKLAATEHDVAWDGALGFGGATDLLAGLLADTRLTKAQLTLDVQADVDRSSKGPERVVAGGDVLALLTDRYAFVKLPVQKPSDVVKVELIDLRGDGTKLVAAQLRQRGGGGSRDLLTLWVGGNGTLQQVYAVEVGKEQGGRRLRSTWKVEPAKAWKQAKGARRVLVVRAEPAVGWDEDSYGEAPAPDAEPIHVPWDDDRVGGVFWINRDDQFDTAPIQRR